MIWILLFLTASLNIQGMLYYRRLIREEQQRQLEEMEQQRAWRVELENFQREVWIVKEKLDDIKRHI